MLTLPHTVFFLSLVAFFAFCPGTVARADGVPLECPDGNPGGCVLQTSGLTVDLVVNYYADAKLLPIMTSFHFLATWL